MTDAQTGRAVGRVVRCGCTADTELAAAPGCAVCGHRDHGRDGCRAVVAARSTAPATEDWLAAAIDRLPKEYEVRHWRNGDDPEAFGVVSGRELAQAILHRSTAPATGPGLDVLRWIIENTSEAHIAQFASAALAEPTCAFTGCGLPERLHGTAPGRPPNPTRSTHQFLRAATEARSAVDETGSRLRSALAEFVRTAERQDWHLSAIPRLNEAVKRGRAALATEARSAVDEAGEVDRKALQKRLTRHHRDEHVTALTCSSCLAATSTGLPDSGETTGWGHRDMTPRRRPDSGETT